MAALADLAPDRRAVLQLLVGRGRSYEQIADLLSVPEIVVRRRAHDAISELAGDIGSIALSAEQRALLSDYLVGELPASRRAQARRLLADDPGARRFARTAAARLSSIKGAQLPELPDEDEEVAEALDALDKRRERKAQLETSSRRGAWLLVAAVAVLVTGAVVGIATIAGGDSGDAGTEITQADDPAADTTTPAGVRLAVLNPRSGSDASGEAAIQYPATGAASFALTAKGLPEPRKLADGRFTAIAVWFGRGTGTPLRVGFYDPAGDPGTTPGEITIALKLDGKNTPALEQSDLEEFDSVIVSQETLKTEQERPETPSRVLLEGTLEDGAQG